MTKFEFHEMLLTASNEAMRFANRYVAQQLPSTAKYRVVLNQSFDGNATSDEVLYPEDDGREVLCSSAEEAVVLLYRDNRCPAWIDVAVEAVGRVAPGDCSPGAPTDPYVQNYRIRFLK
jgi:hypothetical protein